MDILPPVYVTAQIDQTFYFLNIFIHRCQPQPVMIVFLVPIVGVPANKKAAWIIYLLTERKFWF